MKLLQETDHPIKAFLLQTVTFRCLFLLVSPVQTFENSGVKVQVNAETLGFKIYNNVLRFKLKKPIDKLETFKTFYCTEAS